jgi:hypothetical protein
VAAGVNQLHFSLCKTGMSEVERRVEASGEHGII